MPEGICKNLKLSYSILTVLLLSRQKITTSKKGVVTYEAKRIRVKGIKGSDNAGKSFIPKIIAN
jgi:hypothetical protein